MLCFIQEKTEKKLSIILYVYMWAFIFANGNVGWMIQIWQKMVSSMGVSSHMEEWLGLVVRYLQHVFYIVLTFKMCKCFTCSKITVNKKDKRANSKI